MMSVLHIKGFFSDVDHRDRLHINKLAINELTFETLAVWNLAKAFTNLKWLILVSEKTKSSVPPPLGPPSLSPQRTDFLWSFSALAAGFRYGAGYSALDLTRDTHADLKDFWDGRTPKVDVTSISRDGILMPTNFPSETYKELYKRQEEKRKLAKMEALQDKKQEEPTESAQEKPPNEKTQGENAELGELPRSSIPNVRDSRYWETLREQDRVTNSRNFLLQNGMHDVVNHDDIALNLAILESLRIDTASSEAKPRTLIYPRGRL
jgi:hypothetical protein